MTARGVFERDVWEQRPQKRWEYTTTEQLGEAFWNLKKHEEHFNIFVGIRVLLLLDLLWFIPKWKEEKEQQQNQNHAIIYCGRYYNILWLCELLGQG